MTSEYWSEVRTLLEDALEVVPEQRETFLQNAAVQHAVIREVRQLLSFEAAASASFSIESWQDGLDFIPVAQNLTGAEIGHYKIVREIGRGGMGAVYLAKRVDGTYEQEVALKVLQEGIFTTALVERFRQERQILARLSHPGVARLLDGGVLADGRPYLVLEYVDGVPIDRYCDEHALSIGARLRLFVRVAQVVQSAHQQLVLHLDLKPANILVTESGEPRLLDFGLARILPSGDSRTPTTVRLLTPQYASPEQATGAPLGVASDVFSLSTLLYRLLTGTLPYPIEGAEPLAATRIITDQPPRLPSSVAPELKGDLDNILLKGLRKEPERRYPTVSALAEDVVRHLELKPVAAHADSFSYRAGKFFRRHRAPVLATAAALAVLAVSVAAVIRSASVARRERAAAENRLRDIQDLARFYVVDLFAALNDIPGTLPVRKLMAEKAVTSLQSISRERDGDPKFSIDLANGLFEMAKTQGFPNQPSLGDLHGAQDVLNLAREMVELHARQVPGDPKTPARRGLIDASQANITNALGEVGEATALEQKAWDEVQPVLLGEKSNRWMQISTYCFFDSVYLASRDQFSMADPVSALTWVNRAEALLLDLGQAAPQFRNQALYITQLAQVRFTKATILAQVNRDDEARRYFEQAMHDADGQNGTNTIEVAEHIRKAHLHYAEFLLSRGQLRKAQEISSILVPPDHPDFARSKGPFDESEYAIQTRWWAILSAARGDNNAARENLQKSLDTSRRLVKSAPEDQTLVSLHAISLVALAESTIDAHVARTLIAEALPILSNFADKHPDVLGARILQARAHLAIARKDRESGDIPGAKAETAQVRAALAPVLQLRPGMEEAKTLERVAGQLL